MKNLKDKKDPSFAASLFVFLSIVGILIAGIALLNVDIHVLLILGLCLTCLISVKYGYTLDDFIKAMANSINKAMTALLILF
jgi:NhaC family Na+:H+ antiporter